MADEQEFVTIKGGQISGPIEMRRPGLDPERVDIHGTVDFKLPGGINIPIPGTEGKGGNPFDPTSQVAKIVKDILPDEIKDLPLEAAKQFVKRAVVPVVNELLVPLEKPLFTYADHMLASILDDFDAFMLQGNTVSTAKYFHDFNKAHGNAYVDWGRWLTAMDVSGYEEDGDAMTLAECAKLVKTWKGWQPFYDALQMRVDVNDISFYVAINTNVDIGLYFNNMATRGRQLQKDLHKWGNRGLKAKRSDIKQFITDLGPDFLDVTATAKFAIGAIAGGSLGAWGVPTRIAVRYLDELLKKIGLPA